MTKMGNSCASNGMSSVSFDTSPTSSWDERKSASMPRRLHGVRGYPHSHGIHMAFPSRGSGKGLKASWAPQAMPMDIPAPYSSTEWHNDFEERFEIGTCLGHRYGRDLYHARNKQSQELVLVEQIDRRRQSLWEEENFVALDVELSVRQDLSPSNMVPTLKECQLQSEAYTILSEPCMGPTLREQLQESRPLSENLAAAVVCSVIEMLAFSRKCLILHGNVTPEAFSFQNNVVNTMKMKQRGFLPSGWLKATNLASSQYILHGGNLGNLNDCELIPSGYYYSSKQPLPLYMAPEMFDQYYSYDADMWSLGVMTYEMVSGKLPFWKSTHEALKMSKAGIKAVVKNREVDLSSSVLSKLSTPCLDFLDRILDKNPNSRLDVYKALNHPWIHRRIKKVGDSELDEGYCFNRSLD